MTDTTSAPVAAATAASALATLSADVRAWFVERFGAPTMAQRLAWPVVAAGENLLLCTPTGSGKTLAGMLPILDRIRAEQPGGLRCLYVAPLKALVQDACTNLRQHCGEIHERAPAGAGPIRPAVRTGDTSSRVRQRQLDEPPPLLLTTPESLAVLLSQPRAAELFHALRWVVVDEVHALVGSKRGADLALALERLEHLAGPLQRVGLSATCFPQATAAHFLAGAGRPCRIARADDPSDLELTVEPLASAADAGGAGFVHRLLARLEPELAANRTTLVFTNTRSLAERITWALRRRYPERADDVAAHHSALAPARRRLVERALKQGRLWAAVSSTSLELGVDIGNVDGVVFVHPPGSVVRLLQRLGRSGHRPGVPRRGLVLTGAARELVEAAVTADAGRCGQIETFHLPPPPLDVLCQHLAGMAMAGRWDRGAAFALVRRAWPYRDLPPDDFAACLDYLSGRHRDGSAWLPARLRWDGDAFTIADDATARQLRRNLGTILSEAPCAVRLPRTEPGGADAPVSTTLVGELDQSYAERLQPGDRFLLDGRCLELRRRDGATLLADEVTGRPLVPRWRGAGPPMSRELASRLYLFRVQAAEALRESPAALDRLLRGAYRLDAAGVAQLAGYLTRQETVSEVPDFDCLLVEAVAQQACVEFYFHTPLPGPANDALARVAAGRLRRAVGRPVVALAADLGFMIVVEGAADLGPDAWRAHLDAADFAADFARDLRDGALLPARFAQVAQTGLMVLRHPAGRAPRVGGKAWAGAPLLDQVRAAAPDFVLLRQAERECGETVCDLAAALAFARRLPAMQVRQRWLAAPSALADDLLAGPVGPADGGPPPDDALRALQSELLAEAPR